MIRYDKVYCWEESGKKFSIFGDPFSLETPTGHGPHSSYRRPTDFHWRLQAVHQRPQIFIEEPGEYWGACDPVHPLGTSLGLIYSPKISIKKAGYRLLPKDETSETTVRNLYCLSSLFMIPCNFNFLFSL